jgi:hypothetical protein
MPCFSVGFPLISAPVWRFLRSQPQAEHTAVRSASIVLCGSVSFAIIHWALNLFVEAEVNASPPDVVVVAGPADAFDSGSRSRSRSSSGSSTEVYLQHRVPLTMILGSAPAVHTNPALTLALLVRPVDAASSEWLVEMQAS